MLQIAITHVDFPLYWQARLQALAARAACEDAQLLVIEAISSGLGNYAFAGGTQNGSLRWMRLYESGDLASLPPSEVSARVWASLERARPDAVICGPVAFTPGATAVRWCRARRRGVVVMDDARTVDVPRTRLINAIKKRVYANVDAMLVPAASHLPTCEFFGIRPDRVFYGYDVVDNQKFADAAQAARSRSGRAAGGHELPERFFLGVGRQVPKKNWPFLVESYARYRSQAKHPYDLVLVGDGPERKTIEARARETAGVHLLPFLAPEDLPAAYARAACLVLPSFHGETRGLVINEAMASGLPVLVSDECGCAQTLVEQGRNGWTFSPHRGEELAELLRRMSELDEAGRAAMGRHSLAIIADWTLERFADGAWNAVRACLDSRRGYAGLLDRLLLSQWKGRFRAT